MLAATMSCVRWRAFVCARGRRAWWGRFGGARVRSTAVVLVTSDLLVNDEIVWAAVAVTPRTVARIALERTLLELHAEPVPARLLGPGGVAVAPARREQLRVVRCDAAMAVAAATAVDERYPRPLRADAVDLPVLNLGAGVQAHIVRGEPVSEVFAVARRERRAATGCG